MILLVLWYVVGILMFAAFLLTRVSEKATGIFRFKEGEMSA